MTVKQKAFTLVELSIVLVILGLLVGGVLAGQSLIHAAELRAVTTEFTSYKTALGAFREKYLALPGDMSNAVRFWGAADGTTADGIDTDCVALDHLAAPTSAATCNGDGNGQINFGMNNELELYRAWQHLANAGLVEGAPNTLPKSKFPAMGWSLAYLTDWAAVGDKYPLQYKNALQFGEHKIDGDPLLDTLMKAEDAYNIDMKMDDGRPQSGAVSPGWTSARNTECSNATDDGYKLDSTDSYGCNLVFITGY